MKGKSSDRFSRPVSFPRIRVTSSLSVPSVATKQNCASSRKVFQNCFSTTGHVHKMECWGCQGRRGTGPESMPLFQRLGSKGTFGNENFAEHRVAVSPVPVVFVEHFGVLFLSVKDVGRRNDTDT